MRSKVVLALIGFVTAMLGMDSAMAGKRTLQLDPYAARTMNGAGRNLGTLGDAGINVPQGGEFGFGMTIPKPYKANSLLRVILQWHIADPNCSVELLPDFLDRTRPGHAPTTGPATGGFVPEDSSIVLTAGNVPGQGYVKVYTISPAQGFDQISGDALLFSFIRGSGANDTCGSDLMISAVTIEYLTP